jgi:hypothetical protein
VKDWLKTFDNIGNDISEIKRIDCKKGRLRMMSQQINIKSDLVFFLDDIKIIPKIICDIPMMLISHIEEGY